MTSAQLSDEFFQRLTNRDRQVMDAGEETNCLLERNFLGHSVWTIGGVPVGR